MKRPHPNRRGLLALLMALLFGAALLTSCGSDDEGDDVATEEDASASEAAEEDEEAPASTEEAADEEAAAEGDAEPVTIEWWHIDNEGAMLDLWQELADEFMETNPNVTIEITALENDTFKPTIDTQLQAGEVPDLFQSWGAADLREYVPADLVLDITDATSGWIDTMNPAAVDLYQVDGVQYGIPYNMGMVGFWYNLELFEQAGITETPATWEEFLETVQALQDAGITPIAVGAGAQWPAHFYYSYLMLRIGGGDMMDQIAADGDFTAPGVIEAGEELSRLIEMEPFQPGFLAADWPGPDGESGTMATGQAAMDLMGQWAPNQFRNDSEDGEGLGDNIGWFPFPTVDGGTGAGTDAFGGADGFVVGRDAPPEAIEFLEFISNVDNTIRIGETEAKLPVTIGSEVSVTDPTQQLVLEGLGNATYYQVFLDQFFSSEIGDTINAEVQSLFGQQTTPEDMADAITAVAQSG